jgi:hypothetical protein
LELKEGLGGGGADLGIVGEGGLLEERAGLSGATCFGEGDAETEERFAKTWPETKGGFERGDGVTRTVTAEEEVCEVEMGFREGGIEAGCIAEKAFGLAELAAFSEGGAKIEAGGGVIWVGEGELEVMACFGPAIAAMEEVGEVGVDLGVSGTATEGLAPSGFGFTLAIRAEEGAAQVIPSLRGIVVKGDSALKDSDGLGELLGFEIGAAEIGQGDGIVGPGEEEENRFRGAAEVDKGGCEIPDAGEVAGVPGEGSAVPALGVRAISEAVMGLG